MRKLSWLAISIPFSFHGFEAATVEVEQLGYVLIRLGPGGAAEACGGRYRAANASGASHKFEQIESDVFIAAGAEARTGKGVHREKSPKRMLPEATGAKAASWPLARDSQWANGGI
jgi:hypothetical protein